jgi:hypothetical protein
VNLPVTRRTACPLGAVHILETSGRFKARQVFEDRSRDPQAINNWADRHVGGKTNIEVDTTLSKDDTRADQSTSGHRSGAESHACFPRKAGAARAATRCP